MRRKDREITDFETIKQIVDKCDVIRIGLADDDLYPYIVPMNFAYKAEGDILYFYLHGAMAGRKYELMQKNKCCSFEMDCDHKLVLIEETKDATMYYKSVMGKASITFLSDEEKKAALDFIMERDELTRNFDYDKAPIPRTAVIKLTVTEITGKCNPGPDKNT